MCCCELPITEKQFYIYWENPQKKIVSVHVNNLDWAKEIAKNHNGKIVLLLKQEEVEKW